jgi:predicted phosphodiesterase
MYKNQEDARTFVRNATNSFGNEHKKYNHRDITHTPDLPPSLSKQRIFVDLPVSSNNILWMSDIHLPNHDIDAINLATKFGIDKKINCIVLGGDILDNTPFTSHDSPPPSADDVRDWFEYAEILFSHLRTLFPKAHIVWIEGNHDNWYVRYLMKKAPVLFNDEYYRLPQRLNLKKYNIEFYDQNPYFEATSIHFYSYY